MMKLSKEDSEISEDASSSNEEDDSRLDLTQLQTEAGPLVQSLAEVTAYLRALRLTTEEYVLLKVLLLTEPSPDQPLLSSIHRTHLGALAALSNGDSRRFQSLMRCIPAVHQAADLLIQSKMFYVPYLLTASVVSAH